MYKGVFITLEGGEGAGKSTQLRLVGEALRERGHDVLITREPGGSPGAEDLRQLLLFGNNPLSLRAEILAHFAARYDHVDRVILLRSKQGRLSCVIGLPIPHWPIRAMAVRRGRRVFWP